MKLQTFYGILIPFLGTSLGSACVFLVKNGLSDRLSRIFTGFAAGVMTAASVWSLSDPVDGAVHFHGKAILPPGAYRFLDWRPLPPASGSCHPAPSQKQRHCRRSGAETQAWPEPR